jgi:hypothetical protein
VNDGDAYTLDWRRLIGRATRRLAGFGLGGRQQALGVNRELDAMAAEDPLMGSNPLPPS